MKSVEWQQKILRANLRVTRVKDKDGNERRNKKLPGHRTKYTARLKKSSSTILTASKRRAFNLTIDVFMIVYLSIERWNIVTAHATNNYVLLTQGSREKC